MIAKSRQNQIRSLAIELGPPWPHPLTVILAARKPSTVTMPFCEVEMAHAQPVLLGRWRSFPQLPHRSLVSDRDTLTAVGEAHLYP